MVWLKGSISISTFKMQFLQSYRDRVWLNKWRQCVIHVGWDIARLPIIYFNLFWVFFFTQGFIQLVVLAAIVRWTSKYWNYPFFLSKQLFNSLINITAAGRWPSHNNTLPHSSSNSAWTFSAFSWSSSFSCHSKRRSSLCMLWVVRFASFRHIQAKLTPVPDNAYIFLRETENTRLLGDGQKTQ